MQSKESGLWVGLGLALALAAVAVAGTPPAEPLMEQPPADGWTLISDGPHPLDTSLRETVWRTPRPPGGPHDWIEVHRYRVSEAGGTAPRAALLYLPGTNMNGEAVIAEEDHNLWFFLARRGIDVWALDYRTHFVDSAGVEDLSFMKAWTLAVFVGDAAAAADLARRVGEHERLFVAGFSRGVTLAYGLAASEPATGIAGVIALDGAFKSHAPAGEVSLAAELRAFDEAAVFAMDVGGSRGWEWRQDLMEAVLANAEGPAPDEGFSTTGEELSQVLYGAWGPGALANPVDGVSRPEVLARLMVAYDRYYPTIQTPEGRSLADHADDPGNPIDDGWAELDTPVLYFGATGMRRWMGGAWLLNGIHSAVEAGGDDFTIHVLEGYGHLDVLVGQNARADVFEPMRAWIEERLP